MLSRLCAPFLALPLFATAVGPVLGGGPAPLPAAELRAHGDATLETLRAGRAPARLAIDDQERLLLQQRDNPGLETLRAGSPTEDEWGWIAIGALIVLILVLI